MAEDQEFNWEEVSSEVTSDVEKKNPIGNEQSTQLESQDGQSISLESDSVGQSTLQDDKDKGVKYYTKTDKSGKTTYWKQDKWGEKPITKTTYDFENKKQVEDKVVADAEFTEIVPLDKPGDVDKMLQIDGPPVVMPEQPSEPKTEEPKKEEDLSWFNDIASRFNRSLLGLGSESLKFIGEAASGINKVLGVEPNKKTEDYATYKLGNQVDEFIKDLYPIDPKRDADLSSSIASGLGSMLGFMVAGPTRTAFFGAASQAAPEYDKTKQIVTDANELTLDDFINKYTDPSADELSKNEIDKSLELQWMDLKGKNPDDVAFKSFVANALIGSSEALPINMAFGRMFKNGSSRLKDAAVSAISGGTEEAFQEGMTQYLSNLTTKELLDENKNLLDDVAKASGTAFILGGTLNASITALTNNYEKAEGEGKVKIKEQLDRANELKSRLPEDGNKTVLTLGSKEELQNDINEFETKVNTHNGYVSNISNPDNLSKIASSISVDGGKLVEEFVNDVDSKVQQGYISTEQGEQAKQSLKTLLQANDKVPNSITDIEKRGQAVKLVAEKSLLEEEIKDKDKALSAPQIERIKQINEELTNIALGKEIQPVTEQATATEGEVQPQEPTPSSLNDKIAESNQEVKDAYDKFIKALGSQATTGGPWNTLPEFVDLVKALGKNTALRIEDIVGIIKQTLSDKVKGVTDQNIEIEVNKILSKQPQQSTKEKSKIQTKLDKALENIEDTKERAYLIKKYISDKDFGDKLSSTSAERLAKKVSNVMLAIESKESTKENKLSELIDYVQKLEADGNYQDKLDTIAKLKKGSNKKIHESEYKTKVKIFSTVKPSNIPVGLLNEYISALSDINQKVPDYRKMDSIYNDVVVSEEVVDIEYNPEEILNNSGKLIQEIINTPLNSVEDYTEMLRKVKKLRNNLNDYLIFANESQRKQIEDNLNQLQDFIDEKGDVFKEALKPIKESLLNDINNNYADRDESFLTTEDKSLLNEYENLSNEELMNLNVSDLNTLSEVFDRLKDGYFPYNQLNNIAKEAQSISASKDIANQIKNEKRKSKTKLGRLFEKYGEYLSQTQRDLVMNMGMKDLSFIEDVLNLNGGAITKRLVAPMTRQLTSMKKGIDDKITRLEKAKPKFLKTLNRDDMNRIGMVMHYLRDYHRQADIVGKSKDPGAPTEPTRDWFGEVIGNEVMMSKYDTANQKLIKKLHKELADKYPDGKGGVDVDKLVNDFKNNPSSIFNPQELKYYNEVKDILNELSTKQKAVNEALGKPFEEEEYYVPMNRLSAAESKEIKTEAFSWDAAKKRADSGKQKISDEVGAVQTDIEDIVKKAILETERDYAIYNIDSYLNKTLNKTHKLLKDGSKDEVMINALKQEMRERARFEFSMSALNSVLNKMRTAKMAYSLYDLGRSGVEISASTVSNPFRTGGGFNNIGRSLSTFTPSDWKLVSNLFKQTGSSLGLKDLQREFGHEGTSGRSKTVFDKVQERVISLPEHTTFRMVWIPAFEQEFKSITGNKFNKELYNTSKGYRSKYDKAIKDAAAVADRNTKKVIGGGTKMEGRRYIQAVPRIVGKTLSNINPDYFKSDFSRYGVVDANSYMGKTIVFFGNYMYREGDTFRGGLEKIANGDFNNGLSESTGILLNMVAYSSLITAYMAAKSLYYEDDKEKYDAMMDDLMNPEKIAENAALQVANSFASKYGALGREALFLSAQLQYSKAKAEGDYETSIIWEKFIKENLFKKPIDDKEDFYKHLVSLETSFGYVIEEVWKVVGGKDGWMELYSKYENGDSLTEEDVDKLKLLSNIAASANIIMAPTVGLVLPGKKALESKIKAEQNKPSSEYEQIEGVQEGDVIIEDIQAEPQE